MAAPVISAAASTCASMATARKALGETPRHPARHEDLSTQQVLATGSKDQLRNKLRKAVHDIQKYFGRMTPKWKAALQSSDPQDRHTAEQAIAKMNEVCMYLLTAEEKVNQWDDPSWTDRMSATWSAAKNVFMTDEEEKSLIGAQCQLLHRLHQELLEYRYSDARLDAIAHNPTGRQADCLLISDKHDFQIFPRHCHMTRASSDNKYNASDYDAIVIVSNDTKGLTTQLMGERESERNVLWICLGGHPGGEQAGQGDYLLHMAGTKAAAAAEQVLSHLGCAVSREADRPRGSMLYEVKGVAESELDVVADCVKTQPLAPCCDMMLWAESFWSKATDQAARILEGSGFSVSAKADVHHSYTKHQQPREVDAPLAAEVVLKNLPGKISPQLLQYIEFTTWGCTQFRMPLEAYFELKEYIAENPGAPWILPYEEDGVILWEEAELHSVELTGALTAQITLPCEDASANVKSLADWLVDLGLGVNSAPPEFLPKQAPEVQPVKDQTIRPGPYRSKSLTTDTTGSTMTGPTLVSKLSIQLEELDDGHHWEHDD